MPLDWSKSTSQAICRSLLLFLQAWQSWAADTQTDTPCYLVGSNSPHSAMHMMQRNNVSCDGCADTQWWYWMKLTNAQCTRTCCLVSSSQHSVNARHPQTEIFYHCWSLYFGTFDTSLAFVVCVAGIRCSMSRDQPNLRRKMRDFTGCFWKYAQFTENSRKEFKKFTENSRAPQMLFRGAMLMQTKKSVELYIWNFSTTF